MKIVDLAKGARPSFCKFDDIDDNYAGVITEEPAYQEDNYNSAREMLVVRLACNGVPYELRARERMIEAILAAVFKAGAAELEAGGFLSVTLIEFRGKAKIYAATYEPPEDVEEEDVDHCGCADPRGHEPIGVGALESDPDDPGHDGAVL